LRTAAIRKIAPHFEHRLFLSATPHNGYPESFGALLELLDDQRFARGVRPDRAQLQRVMVRRLKSELPPRWDGSPRFPRRVIDRLVVPYGEEERAVHAALTAYAASRSAAARAQGEGERVAAEFVLTLLKKRLFSSPAAFASTLDQHLRTLTQGRAAREIVPTVRVLRRAIDATEDEFGDDATAEEATIDALATAAGFHAPLRAEERRLLDSMRGWAERARDGGDTKAGVLLDWLGGIVRPGGIWNDERVIVFTEYRDTQRWLQERLVARGLGGERLAMLYGGMDEGERERIKAEFQADPSLSPVRILLATDAASEGIDLQRHCHRLVHYEIPWNPNRLEQRNGRIDRHGQPAREVRVFHFVGAGYEDAAPGSLEGDLQFLWTAVTKVEAIREDLGSVGPASPSRSRRLCWVVAVASTLTRPSGPRRPGASSRPSGTSGSRSTGCTGDCARAGPSCAWTRPTSSGWSGSASSSPARPAWPLPPLTGRPATLRPAARCSGCRSSPEAGRGPARVWSTR
jgi:hypothetical protein